MIGPGYATIWLSLKATFHIELHLLTFNQSKRHKFYTLTQGNMTNYEYKQRQKELPELFPNLISNTISKTRRFLNGLSEPITLTVSSVAHLMYQFIKDEALDVERQTLMHRSKHLSFDGMFSRTSRQESSKRGSSSSRSSTKVVMDLKVVDPKRIDTLKVQDTEQ